MSIDPTDSCPDFSAPRPGDRSIEERVARKLANLSHALGEIEDWLDESERKSDELLGATGVGLRVSPETIDFFHAVARFRPGLARS